MRKSQERAEYIDRMIDNIHQIPLQNVIGQRMDLKRAGRHYQGLCPFHRAKSLGSFLVTPDKGIWKCFACGDGYAGDAIKFVSLYENISWLDAAFKIGAENGFVSNSEMEQYSRGFTKAESARIEAKHTIKETKTEKRPKAAPAVIEKVYQLMKELSPLSKKHEEHLRDVRQLSDERIKADYFTFPYYGRDKIVDQILSAGIKKEDLVFVPGFFYDRKKGKISYAGTRGIGILIRGVNGQIRAIQIRRDVVKEGESRYLWFSSTFATNSPETYYGGAGCGSAKDVLLPKDEKKRTLCITEGRFKSEKIVEAGNACISLQGVTAWRGIDKDIREIQKNRDIRNLFIMFDADMMENKAIFDQTVNLCRMLGKQFPNIYVRYALWPIRYGKGIDDAIISGHTGDISYKNALDVHDNYEYVYAHVLEKNNVKNIREVEDIDAFRNELREELEFMFF